MKRQPSGSSAATPSSVAMTMASSPLVRLLDCAPCQHKGSSRRGRMVFTHMRAHGVSGGRTSTGTVGAVHKTGQEGGCVLGW